MKHFGRPEDVAEIRGRLAALTATDRRRWGRMDVGEMICHLGDSFAVPLGWRGFAPARIALVPAWVIKWVAFRSGLKWRPNMPTLPEIKHDGGGTRPVDFGADMERLNGNLEAFLGYRGRWSPHPFFGELTTAEWMRWGYLHFDHHLRQFGR